MKFVAISVIEAIRKCSRERKGGKKDNKTRIKITKRERKKREGVDEREKERKEVLGASSISTEDAYAPDRSSVAEEKK